MFDPRDPYERFYWHYESRRPLSVAQIIALGSVDAEAAGLIWLLLEQKVSLTVAGPTDPQPGVGKTTTLNALLQFLPQGTALAYMSGMYENFAFMQLPDIEPENTYALCNEVSDHLSIYMWGRIARRYLSLPMQGYHIATSVHADTVDDVITMYHRDLRLPVEAVRHLGLIINIGLADHGYSTRRRWFSTHFIRPDADPARPNAIVPVQLSSWNSQSDTFELADQAALGQLAGWLNIPYQQFRTAHASRTACLRKLVRNGGAGASDLFDAIEELRNCENGS